MISITKKEVISLDEGHAILYWPETLSAESVADFEYWMTGIVNLAKRRSMKNDDTATIANSATVQPV